MNIRIGAIRRFAFAGVAALLLFLPANPTDPTSTGLPIVAVRMRELTLFLVLSAVLTMVGTRLLLLFGADRKLPALEIAASYVVGQGVVGAALLLMGLSDVFSPLNLKLVAIGLAFLAPSPRVVRKLRMQWHALISFVGRWWASSTGKALVVGMALLTGVLIVMSLGPLITWDGPMYHVDLPHEFLEEGGFFLPDDNLHVAFIAAPQMLLAIPMTVGGTAYLAFSQAVSFALMFALVASAVSSWVTPLAGKLTGVLILAFTGIVYSSQYDKVDMSFVLAVLVVVFWVLSIDQDSEDPSLPYLGLVVGGALLTKYQSIPYLIGAAVLLAWLWIRGRVRLEVRSLLLGAGVALAVFLPFMLKNWVLLDAPLYPFLTERIPYPWLASLGLELSNGLHEGLATLDNSREPFNFVAYVLSPVELSIEAQGKWYGFPAIYLLGVGGLFTHYRRLAGALLFVGLSGIGLVLAVTQTVNLRYFMPSMPLFAAMTAIALCSVFPDGSTFVRRVAVAVAVAAALTPTSAWLAGTLVYGGRLQVGLGTESEADWLERPALQSNRNVRHLGDVLSSDEYDGPQRTLLLYEARGYYLGPEVIQDNSQNNWLMLEEALGGACLQSNQVSHVVFATDTYQYLRERGLSETQLRNDEFEEFARRCLVEVERVPGYDIYRVR